MKRDTMKSLVLSALKFHGPTTREGLWARLRAYRVRCGFEAVRFAVRDLLNDGRVCVYAKRKSQAGGTVDVIARPVKAVTK
jgi:hypothetical protein